MFKKTNDFYEYANDEVVERLEEALRDNWGLNIDDTYYEQALASETIFRIHEVGSEKLLITMDFSKKPLIFHIKAKTL